MERNAGRKIGRLVAGLLAPALMTAVISAGCHREAHHDACAAPEEPPPPEPRAHKYEETVHRAYARPGVVTSQADVTGKPARIACGTCHGARKVEQLRQATAATPFHAGIKLQHGDNACTTCHNPPTFAEFRLGGDEVVAYADVMKLCGRCHGDRLRDYRRGTHGGMSGYWDLDSGPRVRNHCLDCHNPHAPAVPRVQPVVLPARRPAGAGGTDA